MLKNKNEILNYIDELEKILNEIIKNKIIEKYTTEDYYTISFFYYFKRTEFCKYKNCYVTYTLDKKNYDNTYSYRTTTENEIKENINFNEKINTKKEMITEKQRNELIDFFEDLKRNYLSLIQINTYEK